MKKFISNYLLAIMPLLALSAKTFSQGPDYPATKEKIYVQTSHVFFKPGETVYFKIYVVKAQDQKPTKLSSVVYAELMNPAGNVLQKVNYKVQNGYAEGSFDFNEQAVGGVYKIRVYTNWMRNENENRFFIKELTLQKVIAPRILMKLDIPGKGYGAGDEVSADFSMRNLDDQAIKNYQGNFAVSIAGAVVQTGNFKTDNDGKSLLKFSLPKELKSNDGLLNITVKYDAYTEAVSRSIPIVLNKIDLQFLPEGGTLVNGLATNIAFKALNENGKAADVKGEIWDDRGNKITSFASFHFGMGKFIFTPEKGRRYTARITSPTNINQRIELPQATDKGVVMNIEKQNQKIIISVNATEEREMKLVGQTKNINYYIKNISLIKGINTIEISEEQFPIGIAQFSLYAENNLPVAERLVFLNENKNLQVSITTDKKRYQPREKVKLTIKTVDENGKPIPSNLSLAVMDDKLWSFADDKQDHILSWLLMSSELKGKVEEPQFYFKKDEPKASPALDLVMLTNGYRYFDYTDVVQQEGKLKFMPDQLNMLSGMVVDKNGKAARANLFLLNDIAGGKAIQSKTGADGLFFFSGLEQNVNYYLFAQAENKKDKLTIRILQKGIGFNPLNTQELKPVNSGVDDLAFWMPGFVKTNWQKHADKDATNVVKEDRMEARQMNVVEFDRKALDEVVVVGFGQEKRKDMAGAIAVVNQRDLMPVNNLAFALQGKIPGLMIANNANVMDNAKIALRGTRSLTDANQPLVVLNGVPLEQYKINAVNPNDIESVTVLKDASATALYGGRAANGVILIESKKLRNGKLKFNFGDRYQYASQLIQSTGPVYAMAKKFYAPKYYSLEASERTDFRETIYWNPVVQTDKNGTAELSFYNSDASTTFRAITEGIGYNGKLGRAEATYSSMSALTVDAKIPPYLTVGDKALIPLVIKNNSERNLTISIKLLVPAEMKTGDHKDHFLLAPDSSAQVLIPLEAIQATKGNVQFIVSSELKTETLNLPISASDKGFPIIETISGNRSSQKDFTISKMIPGSLHADLKIYKNLEGQLLDGIESMLREPGGCFEQTSSSTYPNIYVLKYLRESGRSNPEIEKKALAYIQNGYKRLIGFETAQYGFEWFGKTPAHEALTAYGLLEFTDLQEFVNVDKEMLARTKSFLMSRRDGKGSFTLASGGYDQFASVPDKIANIYIVYALTQAGIGKEIIPEYNLAVKKAMESNDGYQLAMMALASSNMKNQNDYRQLMDALNDHFIKTNLASQTSVVNSRDASLRVETMALYALALMRESNPKIGAVAAVVSKILSEKTYYGYGSTQATVLALEAIVEYSKLVGKISNDAQIKFALNNTAVTDGENLTAGLKEGSNSFSVKYADEEKAIPYNLELSYNSFTPPNSDKAELRLTTGLKNATPAIGQTVRMEIEVKNQKNILQPMAVAKIGIPAGLSVQPWQLKEIMEKNQVAYYEIFDNYLVFYWMGFAPNEIKKINLDLKAEIEGSYRAKASNVYLYYTPEYKNWNDGVAVEVRG